MRIGTDTTPGDGFTLSVALGTGDVGSQSFTAEARDLFDETRVVGRTIELMGPTTIRCVANENGNTIAAYLMGPGSGFDNDPLRFEKHMIDRWAQRTLGPRISAGRPARRPGRGEGVASAMVGLSKVGLWQGSWYR